MFRYLSFLLFSFAAVAQTVDLSKTPVTLPVTVGVTLPATCVVGQMFFNSAASAGSNLYGCTAANVWTVENNVTAVPIPVPTPTPTPIPTPAPVPTGTTAANGIVSYGAAVNSVAVPAGKQVKIVADRQTTWALSGPGSIVSQSGSTVVYSAPSKVAAANAVFGCSVLPIDSIYSTPIDTLPVASNSAAWITQSMSYGVSHVTFGQSWGVNVVDSTTPATKMSFLYTPGRNGLSYPLPTGNNRIRETGSLTTDGGNDHHLIALNKNNCHFYETYHDYLTGLTPSSQLTANSGYDYTSGTYALPVGGTTDAAGLPLLPLTVHLSEMQAGVIKHALRFTACTGCIGSPAVWPATGSTANVPGATPMGSRWRLKSSFDISHFSPKAQIILKALQTYGMILADIGGSEQVQVAQDINMDPIVLSAMGEIGAAQITPTNFDVVDESSLMLNPNSIQAANQPNSSILTGKDASGNIITVPVAVQPVIVGTPYPVIYPQAGTPYQIRSWVNGSSNQSVVWTLTDGAGSVTPAGLYTPPQSVSAPTRFRLVGTAQADPTNPVYVSGVVLPSGTIRIDVGSPNNFTDSNGNLWLADNIGVLAGSYYDDNESYPYPAAKWGNVADWLLYATFKYTWGDDLNYGPFVVPNGTYNVSYYFAEPNCTGTYDEARTFDNGLVTGGTVGLDVNGALTMYSIGQATHDTCLVPAIANVPVTVTNNILTVALRAAGTEGAHQAPFLNALSITKQVAVSANVKHAKK